MNQRYRISSVVSKSQQFGKRRHQIQNENISDENFINALILYSLFSSCFILGLCTHEIRTKDKLQREAQEIGRIQQ